MEKPFQPSMPRIARCQVYRSNVNASNPEDFYRTTLYNEFLSHVVTELEKRFVDNSAHGIGLLHLPIECSKKR